LELNNDGAILAIGTFDSGWTEPNLGGGTRLLWYPRKAAFRAGYVDGTQWDDANIGDYSVAMGLDTKASRAASTAMGAYTTASGAASTAMGIYTTASGSFSTAMGVYTTASEYISTAMGGWTTASGDYSTAMGYKTIASGYYSTAIGREIEAKGDYSIAIALNDQNGTVVSQPNTMAIMGGKVGIGTTAPNVELDVIGSIEYTGTITDVSDIRLKENIQPIEGALDKLLTLRGFSFNDIGSEERSLGLSAQEVQKVFPEAVSVVDKKGHLGLDYMQMVPPIIEAIKEQQAQIEELKLVINQDGNLTQGDTSQDLSGGLGSFANKVRQALSALGLYVEQGIARVKELVVQVVKTERLEVGSSDIRTGITLYDEETGQPYCVKVKGGELVNIPGKCGE
jgi:hypothetical protein